MLWSEWMELELQIVEINHEVERIASSDAACLRLLQIPGIGPLVATAIAASIRQRGSLPQRTRVCGVDGSGAQAALDRRQGEAVWNQQARKLLPP